jgi:hypothetical protein
MVEKHDAGTGKRVTCLASEIVSLFLEAKRPMGICLATESLAVGSEIFEEY